MVYMFMALDLDLVVSIYNPSCYQSLEMVVCLIQGQVQCLWPCSSQYGIARFKDHDLILSQHTILRYLDIVYMLILSSRPVHLFNIYIDTP